MSPVLHRIYFNLSFYVLEVHGSLLEHRTNLLENWGTISLKLRDCILENAVCCIY